jgi:hypothetical protein
MTTKQQFIKNAFVKSFFEFTNFEIFKIHQFDKDRICLIFKLDGELIAIDYTDKVAEYYYNLYLEYDRAATSNKD